MLQDTNMERYPVKVFTGADIADIAPTSFEPELLADGLKIYIAGAPGIGAFASALAQIVRPLPAQSTGQLVRQFLYTPDDAAATYCWGEEFDERPTDAAGWTYPLDKRIVWALNGQLQISSGVAAGKIAWNNSGIQFGPVGPVPVLITEVMSYDTTARTCSILSVKCGNILGTVPLALRNQPAFNLQWTPGTLVLQRQPYLVGAGAFSNLVANDTMQYVGS
jgi:hypothetical protein